MAAACGGLRIGKIFMKTIADRFVELSPEQRRILQQRVKQKQKAADGIPVLSRESDSFRVSCAQQRLWFVQQLDPSSTQYNLPAAASIQGPLDIDALERTFNEIVRRHESLRTTFKSVNGEPVQVIAAPSPAKCRLIDLSGLAGEAQAAEADRCIQSDARTPFDLASGPLFRWTLVRLGSEQHILVLNFHHVIADNWSAGILVKEILALYDAFRRNTSAALPAISVQYVDYSEWQRRWLESPAYAGHLAYWTNQLQGVPALQIPRDRQRRALRTHPGAAETVTIPSGLARSVRAFAQAQGATPFMALLGAFQILLCRYTGQTDFAVGSPIAGRTRPETAGLIGCFVNMLPLRADLSGEPTVVEVLDRAKRVALDAYANQDVPFDRIVEAAQPERDLHRAPLFQVLFGLRDNPVESFELGAARFHMLETHTGTAKFELSWEITESGDGWTVAAEYETDVLERSTVQRMLGHYLQIVKAMCSNPGLKVAEVALLSDAEQQQLLVDFNNTGVEFPNTPVYRLFEECVAANPAVIAVVHEGASLSYAELNRQANRLAHHLRSIGVGPDVLVAIALDRSIDMIVAMLATLKAGGAYLPIDLSYPADRIAFMLEDSNAAVLISADWMGDRIPATTLPFVMTDLIRADERRPSTNPGVNVRPENLVYMIYTSGSTGKPKGAQITHCGLTNYLQWAMKAYDAAAGLGAPVHSSISFDLTVTSVYAPLLSGRTVHLASEENAVESLCDVLRSNENFSLVKITPAHLRLLAGQIPADQAAARTRSFIIGGEGLFAEDIAFWQRHAPATALVNEYGPTETVVGCAIYTVPAGRVFETAIPIGRPIANMELYVLDANLRPVPAGVAGELYIGGAGVARAYHRRPQLTAEKFVPHPFSSKPGARLYRTGDLARHLSDGNLEYLGRIDHQVKIRGYRVELGEVEAELQAHALVDRAFVMVREDVPGDRRLVAYVVATGSVSAEELKNHVRSTLPAYMVPSAVVLLSELPLTVNGKVDRSALPAPEASRRELGSACRAPRNASEELLAGLFADLLSVDRVGIDESFFELGGHSLLASQLISRIRSAFGVELPLRAVFECPSVAALAQRIASSDCSTDSLPITPADRTQPVDLSFAQQRLWFMEQLIPDSPLYHIPAAIAIDGPLDVAALEHAVSQVVARHESLRTRFVTSGDQTVQVINPGLTGDFAFSKYEITGQTGISQLVLDAVREPFNLSAGPLVRFALARVSEQRHVLIITMHHIITDGWSINVLIDDLQDFYRAHVEHSTSTRPEPPIQYADYAGWQREWLASHGQEQLDYWKGRLAGSLPILNLPADHPQPTSRSWRGDRVQRQVSVALASSLAKLSRQHQATLFMTLLAAWKMLLGRYAAQSDILVGTPIANRPRPELESLIGLFVNTLVLRTDLSGDPTFTELLQRVREVCLGAYAHQDLPFEQLVEALQPGRDTSHHPLFQVMFALHADSPIPARVPGLNFSMLNPPAGVAKFDLTLECVSSGDSLEAAIEYSTELFEASTIHRMLDHFFNLLHAITADPAKRLSELSMLSDAERHQLLVEFNRTMVEYPNLPVHRLFEACVEKNPDAIAVIHNGVSLTYAELNRQANRLAHHLRSVGVGPEVLVAIALDQSADLVVAILATMKAGGAYVPLDLTYPADRLAYMLEDSKAAVVISAIRMMDRLPATDVPAVMIDLIRAEEYEPSTNLNCEVHAQNLVYMLYTSGSTGKPKGTLVTHAGLANYLQWCMKEYDTTGGLGAPVQSSISFDGTVTCLYGPLLSGRAVYLTSDEHPIESMCRILRSSDDFTLVSITPAHLRLLAEQIPAEEAAGRIRNIVVGGEALYGEDVAFWQRYAPATAIVNEYGPTEAVVGCSYYTVPAGSAFETAIPIGRPIANMELYVLDAEMRPVPAGVPGELYIGGVAVARGYHGRPQLTGEKFVPHPFSSKPGARLYRSGDLVRHRVDGNLEYLGRIDHQVKIRGFRIEPGEIQARLAEHPGVADALVLAREERPSQARLIAYVVAEGAGVSIDQLRRYLSADLPEYMIPSAFVFLDAFPLTVNGKVDRNALPVPDSSRPDLGSAFRAPRNASEELLAGLFADLLGLDGVGIDDSFFDLGGHSLLATQLVSRIRSAFRVDLPLRAVFESPSVAALAQRIATSDSSSDAAPIVPIDRSRPLALSFAQQRLWFLDQLIPDSPLYHIPAAVAIDGALDVAALEHAVSQLVVRHESLRTRFVTSGDQPVQVIMPAVAVTLPVQELSSSQLDQAIVDAARRPFDLASGSPARFSLIRLSEERHVLVLTLHHIVADGWSINVLIEDLLDFYRAHLAQQAPGRPEPVIQYADYATWQRQWLQSHGQAQLEYWKNRLAGSPPVLDLPADHPRPSHRSWRGDRIQRDLPETLSRDLAQLSRRHQSTMYMTLLAAWKLLLSRYSSQSDILVGTPIANRTRPELESLIGFFVNTLVLRTDLSGDPTFVELLGRVREVCLGAYAHQDLPFDQIVEAVQPDRNTSHHPVFQVMFMLRSESPISAELPGLHVSHLDAPAGISKFDVTIEFVTSGDSLQAGIEYSTELFEASTIDRMMDHLFNLLQSIVSNPTQRLSDLTMLSEAERHQLLVEFNRTAAGYPDQPIHRLIEDQVKRTPDAPAVTFEDATLSYAELDRRANRLAHYLQSLGVGVESLVGVCMERSTELVVALLGIVKAGAAYVPLDPEYPADRLEYMVQDAGLDILLTLERCVAAIPPSHAKLVCLDRDWSAIAACSDLSPAVTPRAENSVYMIYTSGSTGRPKGAVNTHGGLVNRVNWMQKAYGLNSSDAVLQKTPFSFDVSVWEFFWPLMMGARLVMARPGGHRDTGYLAAAIRQYGITTLHFVPSMLQVFLEEPTVSDCTTIRRVIASGEALSAELQKKFFERMSAGAGLFNLYGPTEAAIDVTHWTCGPDADLRPVPIGRPIDNTEILILDSALQPVPAGVVGELYIGGHGLARGYYGRPDLTADRFIPHPFGLSAGSRLYRTGDLARFRHDGAIDYLGRTDHQIKIRGFRVELGEIQARLAEHPAVSEALVLAVQDRPGQTRLVAYLVAKAAVPSTDELRAHLAVHLPEYMVPSAFMFLDAFPVTPNGKLDRKALPAPDSVRSAEAFVGPRNAVEEQICRIWCDVLGIESISIDENFFAAGGNSLHATQVVSRIRVQFSSDLPLMTLFEHPTVRTIAPFVRVPEGAPRPQPRRTITAAPRVRSKVPMQL
jgi:amino acid adenylation domain-containing protein